MEQNQKSMMILCFLTGENTPEKTQLQRDYFAGFSVSTIPELPTAISSNPNTSFIVFINSIDKTIPETLSAIPGNVQKNFLRVLILDKNVNHARLPFDVYDVFDVVLNTRKGYEYTANVVKLLVGNGQPSPDAEMHDRRFKTLVNNLPGVAYQCKNDSDWTMLYLSRKMEKLSGYPAKAFINNKDITFSDIILPKDREYVWLAVQKSLKKKLPFQIEYRIRTASGRIKWVWEQGRAIPSENGNELLEGVIIDIDTQKHLEKRIELMREIVLAMNASNDLTELIGIIRQELSNMIVAEDFNLSLFDWDKREFLVPFSDEGREFYKHILMTKTLDAMVIKRNRSIFLKKAEILKLERQGKIYLDGDAPEVWLGVPLEIGGKAAGVIALEDSGNQFAINETDIDLLEFVSVQLVVSILKKQAEDESRKLLKALEQSPISVMIADLEGHILYANNKAAEISGVEVNDLMGKIPNIIEPYKTDAEHFGTIWKALKETGAWEGEFENEDRKGRKYWEYARLSSIKNARGKTTHYVYVKEDISDRKKIETELRQAKVQAEESDKLKTAFLANMSHEIRTPMNAIIGFSEMMRTDDFSEEEHHEFLDLIIDNSKKLLSTLDNIIDIAKIEAGQMTFSNSLCSANKILYDNFYAFEKRKTKLDKSLITFEARQFRENENFMFISDPVRINQVLSNLLENAFKYTGKGIIEFGYKMINEQGQEYIDYYVKDSGQGISPAKMESIFNRFTQVSDNYMSTTGGTGLGLAISRNIARLMNGDIRLDSRVGKGSVFHFLIPYTPARPGIQKVGAATDESGPEYEWPGNTVLIAEDEDSNFQLLEIMLRRTKVRIDRAYNGKQAVDYVLGGNDVDLVLMDVRMPVMNGYEATEHIKKFNPDLPVIIQTAFAMNSDRENSFEAGCDEYLSKPIKATDLYRVMKKFLS